MECYSSAFGALKGSARRILSLQQHWVKPLTPALDSGRAPQLGIRDTNMGLGREEQQRAACAGMPAHAES